MARIDTILRMVDNFTRPMRQAIRSSYDMQRQTERLEEVTRRYQRTSRTSTDSISSQINRLAQEYVRLGISAQEAMRRAQNSLSEIDTSGGGRSGFGRIATGVIAANQGLQLIQQGMRAVGQVTDVIDNYTLTRARIDLMNDGLQTTQELQEQIFQAAQRSRGSYETMAASIAKMGILAGDAFKNNDEIIAFTELVQKSFKIGGASTVEQQAGMYQLTQAMAAGRLQGDEFRSISENAPMISQAIAKATGKSMGDLKEMSAEGTITADVIKKAMFMMSNDINKKFETIPKTFGDFVTSAKNIALMKFGPMMDRIIKILNSPGATMLFNNLIGAITIVAHVAMTLLSVIVGIYNFVASNWSIIEPIIWGIGGAIIAYLVPSIWTMVTGLWAAIPPLVAQAVAWLAINWPILLIGAAIALLIYAIIKWSDITIEVIGVIGGIFGVLFAFLFNKFALIANNWLSVLEFFANVAKDPVYAVKKLFYDMSLNVLSFLGNIALGIENIINKIPGLNISITGGMENLYNKLNSQRDSLKSEKELVKLNRMMALDYGTAFNLGQDFGKKIGGKAVNSVKGLASKIGGVLSGQGLADKGIGGANIDKIGTVDTVGKIKDDVNIAEEDIKLMRELAEQKAIQNFVTLKPNINTKIGTIRENADADRLLGQLTEKLINEVANSAEGVYA